MWKYFFSLILLGFSYSCGHAQKEELVFARFKGTTLKGDLWRPLNQKKAPLVFVVHGGSWSGRDKKDMDAICEALVEKGYAAFNLNYRLAPEYPFPAAIEDFQSAVRFLKLHAKEYHLDFSRLGAWGYSAGAQIALLGALKLEGEVEFKALISGAGPMNLSLFPKDKYIETYLNTSFKKNPQLFYEASPYYFITEKTPPVFLYHSKSDTTVSFRHTDQMIETLEAHHVPYDLYEVKFLNHFFTFVLSFESVDRSIDFLETHVKK